MRITTRTDRAAAKWGGRRGSAGQCHSGVFVDSALVIYVLPPAQYAPARGRRQRISHRRNNDAHAGGGSDIIYNIVHIIINTLTPLTTPHHRPLPRPGVVPSRALLRVRGKNETSEC